MKVYFQLKERERNAREKRAKSAVVRAPVKCIQGQRGAWPGVRAWGSWAGSHREEFLLARSAGAGRVLLGRLDVLKGKRRTLQAQTCRVGAEEAAGRAGEAGLINQREPGLRDQNMTDF